MAAAPPDLLVIVGPTASGKSAFALRLAEALGGEIVGADSVQIYRRFDVGSGKPNRDDQRRARHHLVDCIEPLESMDAAQWAAQADSIIADIRARGLVPIVCGGTFLWVRALVHGLAPAPPASDTIRQHHRERAEAEGRAALHAELAQVDPTTAAKLAPNDFVRVSRALEVHVLSGVPLSTWHARHGFRDRRHDARLVGIRYDPVELERRIEARVQAMLDRGWVEEVRELLAAGLREARAMGSVGYRQVVEALEAGEAHRETLVPAITRATKIFARRQRTWLREEPVSWLDPTEAQSWLPDSAATVRD